ncbi:unnamed protein product [Didymodactylos carnosus]|uniref:Uncharacterized protein n=1 Tax=Didymodactylos carnosus TaxID=1234261 RepID=A0A816CIR7_9BILA|nr:unnamed protein product [Didymodactylos carnosus]CAF4379306.1 unnamed protein product [Didymodactylos carnosus]CAF4513529.1 unnamed protein product [Didymodactylos carnosus]
MNHHLTLAKLVLLVAVIHTADNENELKLSVTLLTLPIYKFSCDMLPLDVQYKMLACFSPHSTTESTTSATLMIKDTITLSNYIRDQKERLEILARIQATVKELKHIAFYSNISSLHSYTQMRKFYNGVNLEETQGKLGGIIEKLNEVDRQESSLREQIKKIQVKLMFRSFENSLTDIIHGDANINLLSSNEQLLIIERLSKNYYDDLDSTLSLH